MSDRGQYGRRYVSSLSAPNPWGTPWAQPSPWGQAVPPWAQRPPIFVGASDQELARAANAPAVTGPVRPPGAVPVAPAAPLVTERTVVVKPDAGVTLGSILKYGAIGALVVGGALAASSLFTTVKKGKEPVRYYADLYREQRGRAR